MSGARKCVFQLDIFFPMPRGKKTWIGLRKQLRRLGPTVVSSPFRRLIQVGCFLLFLWLFFYVCWPYGARPAELGKTSTGWQFSQIEQDNGLCHFERKAPDNWQLDDGADLHLVDPSAADTDEAYVATFQVVRWNKTHLVLTPAGEWTAEMIDRLLIEPGPWSMHETRPNRWPAHYADDLARKEAWIPADLFLVMDPLVSLSTAVASRQWVGSLSCAAAILIVCIVIPRGFCGYVCPLGTLIDGFDWAVGRLTGGLRVRSDGWWVHLKYYLLCGVMIGSLFGVLVSGYVAAIPVMTRGLMFLGEPLQSGLLRGWHQVPPMGAAHVLSIGLFCFVLALGLFKPRFWCRYVCPSGAIFSLGNLLRVSERKVESSCIHCNKCVEICPFDAIKADFTTRGADCTLCQTCAGVCPTHSIKFVERWNRVELKTAGEPPTRETGLGRRGFLSWCVGTAAALVGGTGLAWATTAFGARLEDARTVPPVRPPGSVPEREFLQMCIRCGECFKVCPNNVLQALDCEQGAEGIWTPYVHANWAGCEPSCNACGQICPTGAIRPLPLEEKRVARMGLALVNENTCLPFAAEGDCQLCVDECNAAGYEAIEFTRVHTDVDETGQPIEGTGFVAPVVLKDQCVGCGLCQTRCYVINAKSKKLLAKSAILVVAGRGREDRLFHGSYRELRDQEARQRALELKQQRLDSEIPVPRVLDDEPATDPPNDRDPFGLGSPF
ncbi:MAG: 4Fe-4S binding protein [Pirellulaceae bacterium]